MQELQLPQNGALALRGFEKGLLQTHRYYPLFWFDP